MQSNNAEITEAELISAIKADELVLHYQPKVCLLRGEVIGAEALVRWQRDTGELVMPDAFIPLAERSGYLGEITLSMLAQSVKAIQRIKQTHSGLSISMNVTPTDLETQAVSQEIEGYLAADLISPSDLQIEITESIAMGELQRVSLDLDNLNSMGITVLMDDFGTGYSSIDRLSQLPFSSLKLDKGVVQRMGTSRQNLDVVKSSISMARELRMNSVAEGVESEGAFDLLVANGCGEAQGYWISKPLTLDDFNSFVSLKPDFSGSQIGRVHQALFNVLHYRKSLLDAAYCSKVSALSALDSVVDPEVKLDAEESRFGLWYYGIGQRIASVQGYAQLEKPFVALHKGGQQFMLELQAGASSPSLNTIIAEVDQSMDALTSALRRLERELLRLSTREKL